MAPPQEDKRQAAREVIDILHEISTLLTVIKELRREAAERPGGAE
ncbi:hypothetical protein AJ80_04237 [Polytolypa hystricis UAMH7299]|uniref:Uncharacterized protein n=1 Tax=Polytolypa hystricis (strain UAMH7299) TaxID=1447883 RepID=A0A2B7YEW7_POLH7|nr:hypothetical protein AJ80_04237 [Polytolypa hystricis UAMH7299]